MFLGAKQLNSVVSLNMTDREQIVKQNLPVYRISITWMCDDAEINFQVFVLYLQNLDN